MSKCSTYFIGNKENSDLCIVISAMGKTTNHRTSSIATDMLMDKLPVLDAINVPPRNTPATYLVEITQFTMELIIYL